MPDIDAGNSQLIAEFRARNGAVSGQVAGLPLLLLHQLGAKSATERVTPLAYWQITATTVAVLASSFGSPWHPAWYHNPLAHPQPRRRSEQPGASAPGSQLPSSDTASDLAGCGACAISLRD